MFLTYQIVRPNFPHNTHSITNIIEAVRSKGVFLQFDQS